MHKLLSFCLVAFAAVFSSCGGEATTQDALSVNGADSTESSTRMRKTKKIFYSIPSPMETATVLKEAGAEYDKDLLNDVLNVKKYTSPSKQALNLGVYGADLSYASVFSNTQESMYYTSCVQQLAKALNVSSVFNQDVVDRMEKNQQDRDSLLSIISDTYWNLDGYLKEEGRDNISAMMIAGGWVEGLFIATQVTKSNDSPALRQRIADQGFSLEHMIGLLSGYDSTEATVAGLLKDMQTIKTAFGDATTPAGSTVTRQEGGMTVIGDGTPVATLTDEQLKNIRGTVEAIRATYIAN